MWLYSYTVSQSRQDYEMVVAVQFLQIEFTRLYSELACACALLKRTEVPCLY
jgi:hypothetical protein